MINDFFFCSEHKIVFFPTTYLASGNEVKINKYAYIGNVLKKIRDRDVKQKYSLQAFA